MHAEGRRRQVRHEARCVRLAPATHRKLADAVAHSALVGRQQLVPEQRVVAGRREGAHVLHARSGRRAGGSGARLEGLAGRLWWRWVPLQLEVPARPPSQPLTCANSNSGVVPRASVSWRSSTSASLWPAPEEEGGRGCVRFRSPEALIAGPLAPAAARTLLLLREVAGDDFHTVQCRFLRHGEQLSVRCGHPETQPMSARRCCSSQSELQMHPPAAWPATSASARTRGHFWSACWLLHHI